MTHLPYIVAAYIVALGTPIAMATEALFRVRAARRRLDALGPRRSRGSV